VSFFPYTIDPRILTFVDEKRNQAETEKRKSTSLAAKFGDFGPLPGDSRATRRLLRGREVSVFLL